MTSADTKQASSAQTYMQAEHSYTQIKIMFKDKLGYRIKGKGSLDRTWVCMSKGILKAFFHL